VNIGLKSARPRFFDKSEILSIFQGKTYYFFIKYYITGRAKDFKGLYFSSTLIYEVMQIHIDPQTRVSMYVKIKQP